MTETIAAALLALAAGAGDPPARVSAALRSAAPAARAAPADDAWIAEDKARHLAMSYAVTAFGFAGARALGMGENPALVAAAAGAVIAGIGKEVHDRWQGGPFSFRDLVADAIGIAAGVIVMRASR